MIGYLKTKKLIEVLCSYKIQGKTYTTKFFKGIKGWTVGSLKELTEEQLKYCLMISESPHPKS